ncbi:uncharacterized protein [Macrobrachium rosenbergii]|uniref:uncharacterized protein isoform X1 n=1 Tax=Macrobrachium rosenbergii TaxID=79674 RepID=UPI0034D5006D
MTEGIRKVSLKEEYVKVLESYSYLYEERPVSIHKDETLLVIRRSNDDWWQVVRPGEKRSFFAPAQHLKVITIPQEQMKQTIKQGLSLQKIQGSEENVPLSRPQGLVLPSQDSKSFLPLTDMQSPSASLSSHSYLTKIEMSRIAVERTDLYPSRSTSTSSFKSESPLVPTRGLSPRNGNADLISRGLVQQVSQESSSSHTSKSSLNDGSRCSMESLTLSHIRKQFMKAASHDELSSDHCRSSLDISQPRAASNEELDSRNSGRDYLFRSNQLSYRHRSNSVDFRIFQKDLSFSELKQGSLDKSRKPRLSKDPGNRRRSWAVEELVAENSRSAFKKGDTKDVSIVLDVPPKLPPKLRKHKPTDKVSLSSESIGKLEGPVDVKLQEVKCGKPPPPLTAPNVKRLSHEYDKGGTLQDSDSSDISGKQHRGLLGRPDGQDLKEVPVALPRKNLPPQLSSFEGKFDVQRSQSGGNILMSQSFSLGEVITRDSNGNQVKGERREGNFEHNSSEYGSLREKGFSDSDEKRKVKKSDSFGRVPGTPDLLRKMDRTPDSMRKVYVSKETYMGCSNSDPSFKISSKASEDRGEEKENEDIFPSRETPTPDSSRAGKLAYQFPPSPKISPQRALFDEWGEYYDETTKRQFYYNKKTREKRWKPPRKVVHSVSIPEVPPFSRSDRFDFGQNQAQTPIPDYPSSPKSLHRLRHNQYEGVLLPPNRSYTLGSSSNHSLHNTEASSHTLPAASSVSPNKTGAHPQLGHTVSLLTTPPAPPASAKPPHVPATPTTPTSPDFPDYSEDDQKYALLEVVLKLSPPRGWTKKYDAYTQTVYFYSKTKGERWFAKSTEGGKIYFYEESGSKSQWKLPEHEDIDDSLDGKEACNRPLSPENRRISLLGENLSELIENTKKEGFLHRTFIMREGKKCRKNWTHSYVRYIPVHFRSGASGVLHFSKTKDEDKKAEVFEFHDICHLEHTNDKKTSRQQVLGLRNGRDTEVLLQFDDKDIADEWFKVLQQHEGVTYDDTPAPEEKKGKKTGDKVKRESSVDLLNDNKGITDKLRSFIKRRPQRELLEKKGIYKEAVFGSTLAELASQDKTGTPLFVLQCIKNIEKCDENLRTDGLYRISGNAAQIQKIRYEIAQRNYTVLSREKDVHNLSGALKLFFRELKEPLIPFANYDDFIQATDFELRRMNQQVEKLSKAVRKLPSENYETLKVLLQHLLRVTEFESDNRMSISNLAIVFGPCLLWRKVTTSNDLMTDVMLHNRVIEGLLTDFSRIFHAKR